MSDTVSRAEFDALARAIEVITHNHAQHIRALMDAENVRNGYAPQHQPLPDNVTKFRPRGDK